MALAVTCNTFKPMAQPGQSATGGSKSKKAAFKSGSLALRFAGSCRSSAATAQEQQATQSQPDQRESGRLRDNFHVLDAEIIGDVIRPSGSVVVQPELDPTDRLGKRSKFRVRRSGVAQRRHDQFISGCRG